MYYFRIRENSRFGIYQPSHISFLEPRQSNLRNPDTYSEPCQTSKIKFFVKIVNGFFVKGFILDVWQGFEYASLICYSLFGKIEGPNKIDLIAV